MPGVQVYDKTAHKMADLSSQRSGVSSDADYMHMQLNELIEHATPDFDVRLTRLDSTISKLKAIIEELPRREPLLVGSGRLLPKRHND